MRGASNPGSIGHDWVKKRFVEDNSKLPFIPSAYTDNKYLNPEEYLKQLDKLDKHTFAAKIWGLECCFKRFTCFT